MAPSIDAELAAARGKGYDTICRTAERAAKLPAGLLLAIASRETGCRDIAGDGGHGRGLFQIDDRSFGDWLRSHGAGAPGAVPPVRDAAKLAAQLVVDHMAFGRRNGVEEADLLKFALSAYNAGAGGALAGYREGDSDRRTAGRNYGADVLARHSAVTRWLAGGAPVGPDDELPTLAPAARGPAVLELKRRLRVWFAANPPAPKFAANAVFGPASVEAVKELQRRSGLDDDGVVGPLTWAALTAPAPHPLQVPALPEKVTFPNDLYPKPRAWNGLQPWIVPQVRAIAERFGLTVTAGWGGHPPHAPRSDHAWGGAVDLAGPAEAMVRCNLWADELCADPFRRGAVFRWVGGPAKDSNGVEPGHTTHVHLSWYRTGPATTIFGTKEFR